MAGVAYGAEDQSILSHYPGRGVRGQECIRGDREAERERREAGIKGGGGGG